MGFPYTMYDVAGMLPLQFRHRKTSSGDADCLFCNGKGKLNINFQKQVYRCNRCGASGGMVGLYASYYGISNEKANEEIYSVVHGQAKPRQPLRAVPKLAEEVICANRASDAEIDQTLRTMLELLPLADSHRRRLSDRGLTAEQIHRYMYRSTPAFGYRKLAMQLQEMGCRLEGVPGFYQTGDGDWTLACNPKCTGFFVPAFSVTGLVQGCQIRLDHPIGKCKYIWFSSAEKYNGTGSGSPVHFVGDPCAKDVLVTEGVLKATVAHCLSGRTFVAIAGAGQYQALGPVLDSLKLLGVARISEAFDMDKLQNENVQRGAVQVLDLAREKGFQVRQLQWDPACKGVDDYFLARRLRGKGTSD